MIPELLLQSRTAELQAFSLVWSTTRFVHGLWSGSCHTRTENQDTRLLGPRHRAGGCKRNRLVFWRFSRRQKRMKLELILQAPSDLRRRNPGDAACDSVPSQHDQTSAGKTQLKRTQSSEEKSRSPARRTSVSLDTIILRDCIRRSYFASTSVRLSFLPLSFLRRAF